MSDKPKTIEHKGKTFNYIDISDGSVWYIYGNVDGSRILVDTKTYEPFFEYTK